MEIYFCFKKKATVNFAYYHQLSLEIKYEMEKVDPPW